MRRRLLTEQEMRAAADRLIEDAGGARALAARLGVSVGYVYDVCNGRRKPGPLFLEALGLRKIIGYERA